MSRRIWKQAGKCPTPISSETLLNPTLRTPLVLVFSTLLTTVAGAQTTPQTRLPQFEVATIKPIDPAAPHSNGLNVYPGGRIILRSCTLKSLIVTAFNLGFWQVSGGEPWINTNLYDIEAKPPQDSTPTHYDLRFTWWRIEDPRLRQMLQALLIDRFRLKLDPRSGTGTVYLLEASAKTPLLDPTPAETSQGRSGDVSHGGDRWVLYNTSMPQLAKFISDVVLHVPVLDHTGLPGSFDAKWTETLTDPQSFTGMDSFPFFLKSLGLKLTKSTGPVEAFFIEHAEPPTSN